MTARTGPTWRWNANDNVNALTVALLYPGDRAARERADPSESRFAALVDAFAAATTWPKGAGADREADDS